MMRPRYSGTLTPSALAAIRLVETLTILLKLIPTTVKLQWLEQLWDHEN